MSGGLKTCFYTIEIDLPPLNANAKADQMIKTIATCKVIIIAEQKLRRTQRGNPPVRAKPRVTTIAEGVIQTQCIS